MRGYAKILFPGPLKVFPGPLKVFYGSHPSPTVPAVLLTVYTVFPYSGVFCIYYATVFFVAVYAVCVTCTVYAVYAICVVWIFTVVLVPV